MSLTSRTNRWTSRAVVILQLIIWNAIGIFLLQRGVSSLRRRMLETDNNNVIETNPSIGLDVEPIASSTKDNENEYDLIESIQEELIDKDKINSPSNAKKHLDAYQVLQTTFNVVTKDPWTDLTRKHVPRVHLSWLINQRDLEGKSRKSRISRIARDKERAVPNGISKEVEKDDARSESVSESISQEEESDDATREESDFVENTSQPMTTGKPSTQIPSSVREKIGDHNLAVYNLIESRMKFSRMSNGSAATAIAMVVIGVLMLCLGPAMIVLRIFDERKRARQMAVLSATAREDLPPTYEQAVFMSEAPRYSTLALNDDRSSSPAPPVSSSPTPPASSSYLKKYRLFQILSIKSQST